MIGCLGGLCHVTRDQNLATHAVATLSMASIIDYHLFLLSPCPMHSRSPNKKWHEVWNWFVDEELQTRKKTNSKHSKTRVYCVKCLEVHLELLCKVDEQSEIKCTDGAHYEQCEWVPTVCMDCTDWMISICNWMSWMLSHLEWHLNNAFSPLKMQEPARDCEIMGK